jgi:hypothetical protein
MYIHMQYKTYCVHATILYVIQMLDRVYKVTFPASDFTTCLTSEELLYYGAQLLF